MKEVAVGVLEEDVDGPLPTLVPGVARPGVSGGGDALVEGKEKCEAFSNRCDRYTDFGQT